MSSRRARRSAVRLSGTPSSPLCTATSSCCPVGSKATQTVGIPRRYASGVCTVSPARAVGTERDGTVYELFVSTLPFPAFTAADVLDLYLHRGSFETVLADEDDEQESDRWYSHTPCGQEFAQILAQWSWNLRLEF